MAESLICPSEMCRNAKDGKCTLSKEYYDKCRSEFINCFRKSAAQIGFSAEEIIVMESDMLKKGYIANRHFNKM